MALFLLCPNLGWIQGQIIFTENSLHYRIDHLREGSLALPEGGGRRGRRQTKRSMMLCGRTRLSRHTSSESARIRYGCPATTVSGTKTRRTVYALGATGSWAATPGALAWLKAHAVINAVGRRRTRQRQATGEGLRGLLLHKTRVLEIANPP